MIYRYATYGYEATKDLVRAVRDINENDYSRAGVYMQQAIEKIAKHYLKITKTDEAIARFMSVHKVHLLLREIPLVEVQDDVDILKSISDCYFYTSYPGENYFELTEEEAVKYFKSTVKVYEKIERLIAMELEDTTN